MLPPFDYFEHRSAWYVRLTVAILALSIASYLLQYDPRPTSQCFSQSYEPMSLHAYSYIVHKLISIP